MPVSAREIRDSLTTAQADLASAWRESGDGATFLRSRAALVDAELIAFWESYGFPETYALAAVGGYGRGELYPGSDVDLLFLLPDKVNAEALSRLENFIGELWDTGLDIGHSVRTPAECFEEADRDITVKTALLESRHLAGSLATFLSFSEPYRADLDPLSFLKAKRLEQAERYARNADTPFALEPNCKESPGGLRDLQIIQWVARAANLGDDWTALASSQLISKPEAQQLARAEGRLRDIRIHLHLLTGRREERLLFDYQEKLASALDFAPTATRRASEVLMQHYYLNAKRVTQLNTLLLESFAERLQPSRLIPRIIIDQHFQMVRDLIEVRDEAVFEREPQTILRCFLLQMQRSEIKGMTPQTLRSLWHARHKINAEFRRDPANRQLFLTMFQQKHLIHVLRRMNQYDILGRYIPAFGRIVGQMQHDLFHVYTVDQHILQVMRNLRRFCMPEYAHEYPFCSRLMTGFDKPWLLYLGALFHDIAKGRGGDHSLLGVADARRFCRDHALDSDDSELVCFLVEHHLTMSAVAQKQDLTDPEVIASFANRVGSMRRLTALYLLTVADIRGTSPKVWNNWKGKLLEDLFRITARLLRGESASRLLGVAERQSEAQRLLRYHGLRPEIEYPLWEQLDTGYFMRHDAEEIAWHTRTLYYRPLPVGPVVRARLSTGVDGIQVMVYTADQPLLFARLCGFFARKGFTIVDAKIHTTRHRYALDSFVILDATGTQPYRDMVTLLEHELTELLNAPDRMPSAPSGRISRQVKHPYQ